MVEKAEGFLYRKPVYQYFQYLDTTAAPGSRFMGHNSSSLAKNRKIVRHRLHAELMELADGGVQMATLPPILVQVERLQVREGMVHLAHAQIAQPIAGDVQLLQHAEPPLARVQHAQQVVVQQQGRQARQMQRPVGRDRLESVSL
uniref:Uncharacterized protein n=1 Tax=Anopheles coluzzii TaxID=1518534 RepID=A0A8W7NZC1_ANOCL